MLQTLIAPSNFKKLGYTFNPQFTDEKATSIIIRDTIYLMLLT